MSLKDRLSKLEARFSTKASGFPIVVIVGMFGCNDGDVIGCGICGRKVMRQDGETLDDLKNRASLELNAQVLFAIYADGSEAC